jgi:hypothetical protein
VRPDAYGSQAADTCIYTNDNFTIDSIDGGASKAAGGDGAAEGGGKIDV